MPLLLRPSLPPSLSSCSSFLPPAAAVGTLRNPAEKYRASADSLPSSTHSVRDVFSPPPPPARVALPPGKREQRPADPLPPRPRGPREVLEQQLALREGLGQQQVPRQVQGRDPGAAGERPHGAEAGAEGAEPLALNYFPAGLPLKYRHSSSVSQLSSRWFSMVRGGRARRRRRLGPRRRRLGPRRSPRRLPNAMKRKIKRVAINCNSLPKTHTRRPSLPSVARPAPPRRPG